MVLTYVISIVMPAAGLRCAFQQFAAEMGLGIRREEGKGPHE